MATGQTLHALPLGKPQRTLDFNRGASGLQVYKGRPPLRAPHGPCQPSITAPPSGPQGSSVFSDDDEVFEGARKTQEQQVVTRIRSRPPLRKKRSSSAGLVTEDGDVPAGGECSAPPTRRKQSLTLPYKLPSARPLGPYAAFTSTNTSSSTREPSTVAIPAAERSNGEEEWRKHRSGSEDSTGSAGSEELLFGDYTPDPGPRFVRVELNGSRQSDEPVAGSEANHSNEDTGTRSRSPSPSKLIKAQRPKIVKRFFRMLSPEPGQTDSRRDTSEQTGTVQPGGRIKSSSTLGRSKTLPVKFHTRSKDKEAWGCGGTGGGGASAEEMRILNRLVTKCVEYLEQPNHLKEEGLFRICGSHSEICKLRQCFIQGVDVNLSLVLDPHTVAGLLKLHLRELRFSLIPRGESTRRLQEATRTGDVGEARAVLTELPYNSSDVLRMMLKLLRKVADWSDVNKMTLFVIAKSVGPSLFHTMGEGNASTVLRFLLDNYNHVKA